MSPIIQTMKSFNRRGGRRPGSGPKPNIEKNLILLDVALTFNVGLDRARRMLAEWKNRPERLIGEKRCRKLRKFAASKDAPAYLAVIRQSYLERREEIGVEAMTEKEAFLESVRYGKTPSFTP
jgi:hypothetical protein